MTGHHRSLRNMFVRPRFQLKLCLYFVVIGLIILGSVSFLVLQKLDDVQSLMNKAATLDLQRQFDINDMLVECVQISLAGFGTFIIFSSIFSLVVGHRVAGPQIAIVAYIKELKNGNYESNRSLRRHDELTEIMDALKDLAGMLKEKEQKS